MMSHCNVTLDVIYIGNNRLTKITNKLNVAFYKVDIPKSHVT